MTRPDDPTRAHARDTRPNPAADSYAIEGIAERAVKLYARHGIKADILNLMLLLSVAHEACPLDLPAMLNGGDADFAHDIGGIARHLDRATGTLTGCFVPRFALR